MKYARIYEVFIHAQGAATSSVDVYFVGIYMRRIYCVPKCSANALWVWTFECHLVVQAMLDAMGASTSGGAEAVAVAERHADTLTARAGSGDPSAIATVCRVSAALHHIPGEKQRVDWIFFHPKLLSALKFLEWTPKFWDIRLQGSCGTEEWRCQRSATKLSKFSGQTLEV